MTQPEVLHGPEGEVGDGEEVELLGRVGDAEPVGEEREGVGGGLEGEGGEVLLARDVHDAHRGAPHVDGVGGHQRAHHEGHEVGRHGDGVGEADAPAALRAAGASSTSGPFE